ncbi:MAG: hypothetical protein II891_07885 [Bacteroidales bacterium]|nr:hypothetical protein [Bacteroidales bacterium]
MQDKLQELTEKLYNEGLSKGKEEGERLLEQARKEAAAIVAKAKDDAAAITAKAEKDAGDLRSKAESDIRMASTQALQATRKDIENLLTGKLADASTLEDPAFLKEIIKSVAQKFDAQQAQDLSLVLPEKLRSELEPWVAGELRKTLAHEVQASFSKKVAGGFSIGPASGGWFVNLTEETFKALLAEYLRPVTRKLLFGE